MGEKISCFQGLEAVDATTMTAQEHLTVPPLGGGVVVAAIRDRGDPVRFPE